MWDKIRETVLCFPDFLCTPWPQRRDPVRQGERRTKGLLTGKKFLRLVSVVPIVGVSSVGVSIVFLERKMKEVED